MPKTNSSFWKNKIGGNVKRDEVVKKQLKKEGWTIIIIWECQLRPMKRERTLEKLVLMLNK